MTLDCSNPKTAWTVGCGVVAALLILPNLDKGLEVVGKLANLVPTAYAAKATAEQVDEKFERYLERQDAVNQAIQGYTQQLQQHVPTAVRGAPPPPGLREWDPQRNLFWCCDLADRNVCFDQQAWRACP